MDDDTELNFSFRAQAVFDALNDATDWTWKGLADAFARRYGLEDLTELKSAIAAVIKEANE